MESKKRVLITGASGQLGSELKDLSKNVNSFEFIFLDRMDLDLSKLSDISTVLSKFSPDFILHGAAYTAVDQAEDDQEQTFLINHLASKAIAEYASLHGSKLIFISTDYVFSGDLQDPIREDTNTDPLNVYGQSKEAAERDIQEILPSAIIIRTSWVYSRYGKNFVKTMLRLMEQLPEIKVVNDQFGSPTYAKDLAQAMIKILQSEQWIPGIYHYSNDGAISWYEFALAIQEFSALPCRVLPVDSSKFPTKARRPAYSILSKDKIKKNYAVDIPNWRDSLRDMLNSLKV